ncbi:carboxylating nicotinate-nucleotide diphosphorylase [Sediminivirga luteola]|uniref:carboxylating nicotinate-nucleotide diphosphorylase n=1 Tax=Sediminivirga luteola TaxID=1774748 RepID=UPI001F56E39C|nr:carboxylating nicotinate-nucleotide diphosphorylase [Sediminivirga luteola]MCI2266937.1 carboxylating nicotinate-nucleotide diphosphorylase [Sediminivirga luteola]
MMALGHHEIIPLVDAALREDAPEGDITSMSLIPEDASARALLAAREPGVLAGGEVFACAFTRADPRIDVRLLVRDGEEFASGQPLAEVAGPARGVLRAERIGLNFLQRMCGIATATRAYVRAVEGTGARITDTRKTTPLLRTLERHAVRCGGGQNHRASLSQAFMAKDNHLALAGAGPGALAAALRDARGRLPHTVHMEVEVDSLEQIEEVLSAGVAGTIMLDNFSLEDLRRGVAIIGGRALVEASGGVTLETVREIALTGVDLISVGALTHHVRSLDLGLDMAGAPDADEGPAR